MALMARDFFVRTDDAMGDALEKQAKAEGRSVSNLIRLAVARYLRDAGALPEQQEGEDNQQGGAKPIRKRSPNKKAG